MHTSKQLNFKSAKSQVVVKSSDDTYLKHIHAKLFRNKKFLTSEVNHVLGYMKAPFPTAEAWNSTSFTVLSDDFVSSCFSGTLMCRSGVQVTRASFAPSNMQVTYAVLHCYGRDIQFTTFY